MLVPPRFSCFNGAAPFRARRWKSSQQSERARRCFNGAAPFRARRLIPKVPSLAGKPGFNGAAPFRARRWSRRRTRCSFARGFNGAAPFRARRCRNGAALPRPFLAGFNGAAPFRARRSRKHHGLCRRGRASTGPRLLGRGDSRSARKSKTLSTASTGPRLLGRGDDGRAVVVPFEAGGFNGAAPFRARRYGPHSIRVLVASVLQRGRAF